MAHYEFKMEYVCCKIHYYSWHCHFCNLTSTPLHPNSKARRTLTNTAFLFWGQVEPQVFSQIIFPLFWTQFIAFPEHLDLLQEFPISRFLPNPEGTGHTSSNCDDLDLALTLWPAARPQLLPSGFLLVCRPELGGNQQSHLQAIIFLESSSDFWSSQKLNY